MGIQVELCLQNCYLPTKAAAQPPGANPPDSAIETDVAAITPEHWETWFQQWLEQLQPLYLGDIIISVDTAFKQAIAQGHPLKTELMWLASHGLLHLLGWDHPDEASLTEMLIQQKALLGTVGVSIRDS